MCVSSHLLGRYIFFNSVISVLKMLLRCDKFTERDSVHATQGEHHSPTSPANRTVFYSTLANCSLTSTNSGRTRFVSLYESYVGVPSFRSQVGCSSGSPVSSSTRVRQCRELQAVRAEADISRAPNTVAERNMWFTLVNSLRCNTRWELAK